HIKLHLSLSAYFNKIRHIQSLEKRHHWIWCFHPKLICNSTVCIFWINFFYHCTPLKIKTCQETPGHYLPRCFSFFFCCFISNLRSDSASFFSRLFTLRAFLCCSCCNFRACWDFVPMPVFSICLFTSRCILLGFFFISLTAVSTAGLNCRL